MANVQAAIDYVLGWEDSELTGIVTVARDGKRTRFGIDEHFHPTLAACLFYTTMGKDAALKIAMGIYVDQYVDPLCIEDIASQDIANRLLALGVNVGIVTAAKMLQDALQVQGDGRIGPITLLALEADNPADVITKLRCAAEAHYREIAVEHPDSQQFLKGWLRRAEA